MRERVAYISFPETSDLYSNASQLAYQKVLRGLNVKFNVNITSSAGMPSGANIEVYNLNNDDMQFLATGAATWLKKHNLFQLYVGYSDDIKMLYSGQVMEATPQSYPDEVLSIRGLSGIKWWGHNIELQKSNLTTMDLIKESARVMGYNININGNLSKNNELLNTKIDNFSFTGSPQELLSLVQSKLGGISGDESDVYLSSYNGQINVWSPKYLNTRNKRLIVSKDTGMIELPQPTGGGCRVKMLLNNGINTGDIIELRSDRIGFLNGEYFVIGITHDGELRGNSWYTTLECGRLRV